MEHQNEAGTPGFLYEEERIYLLDEDGKLVAEVTFPAESETTANLNHTFVDVSLRGQGIADQLLRAAADRLRGKGKRIVPTCSYAVKWFEKNSGYADLLARE